MIDPTKLRKRDIGRRVVYTPSHGKPEHGRVTSFNKSYVFVHYDGRPCASNGVATRGEDLEWESGARRKGGRK